MVKKALIIGINDYIHERSLSGCTNDANRIEQLLNRFHFDEIIKLLDWNARRADVLNKIYRFADECQSEDDVCVIHFSGHGSENYNPNKDNNFNEILLFSDVDENEYNDNACHITDDEICNLLKMFLCKVVLIVDCCHSGDITRNPERRADSQTDIRGVPIQRHDLQKIRDATSYQRVKFNKTRKSDDSGWLNNVTSSNYVLLAACRDRQEAREINSNGTYYGILTNFFCQIVETLLTDSSRSIDTVNWQEVYETILKTMSHHYNRTIADLGRLEQEPQLEGLRELQLFGSKILPVEKYFLAQRSIETGSITLHGGALHGITVGTRWHLFDQNTQDFDINTAQAEGTTESVNVVTCVLSIQKSHANAIQTDFWRATKMRSHASAIPNLTFNISSSVSSKCSHAIDTILKKLTVDSSISLLDSYSILIQPNGIKLQESRSNDKCTIVYNSNKEAELFVQNVEKFIFFNHMLRMPCEILRQNACTMFPEESICFRLLTVTEEGLIKNQWPIAHNEKLIVCPGEKFYFEIDFCHDRVIFVTLLDFTCEKAIKIIGTPLGGQASSLLIPSKERQKATIGAKFKDGYLKETLDISSIPQNAVRLPNGDSISTMRILLHTYPADFHGICQSGIISNRCDGVINAEKSSRNVSYAQLSVNQTYDEIERCYLLDVAFIIKETRKETAVKMGLLKSQEWNSKFQKDRYKALISSILPPGHEHLINVSDAGSCFGKPFEIKIKLLKASDNHEADIFFIHGPLFNSQETWHTEMGEKEMWPSWLVGDLSIPVRIYSIDYNGADDASIFKITTDVLSLLEKRHTKQKTYFVAHGSGGLITMSCLVKSEEVRKLTKGVLFLDWPWKGIPRTCLNAVCNCFGWRNENFSNNVADLNESALQVINQFFLVAITDTKCMVLYSEYSLIDPNVFHMIQKKGFLETRELPLWDSDPMLLYHPQSCDDIQYVEVKRVFSNWIKNSTTEIPEVINATHLKLDDATSDNDEEQSKKTQEKLNLEANAAFKNGDYREAETIYSAAINVTEPMAKLYSNRSAARGKLEDWNGSLSDAKSCLAIAEKTKDIDMIKKAFFRISLAYFCLNQFKKALSSIVRSLEQTLQDGQVLKFPEGSTLLCQIVDEHLKKELTSFTRCDYNQVMEKLNELDVVSANDPVQLIKVKNDYLKAWWSFKHVMQPDSGHDQLIMCGIYDALAVSYKEIDNYDMTIACCWVAISGSVTMEMSMYANACGNLGVAYMDIGNFEMARRFFDYAIQHCDNHSNPEYYVAILNKRGVLFSSIGQHNDAMQAFYQAYDLSNEIKFVKGAADAYGNMGMTYRFLGNYDEAINHHMKAVEMSRSIKDYRAASTDLSNIGICFHYKKDYQKAIEYMNEAKNIYPTDYIIMAQNLQIGNVYTEMSKSCTSDTEFSYLFRAEELFHSGLSIASKLAAKHTQAAFNGNLGQVYVLKGNFDEARQYFESAIEIFQNVADEQSHAQTLTEYGYLLLLTDNVLKSVPIFTKALSLYDNIWAGLESDNFMLSWGNSVHGQKRCSAGLQASYELIGEELLALEITERGRAAALRTSFEKRTPTYPPGNNMTTHEMQKFAADIGSTFVVYFETSNRDVYSIDCWIIPPLFKDITFHLLDHSANLLHNHAKPPGTTSDQTCQTKETTITERIQQRVYAMMKQPRDVTYAQLNVNTRSIDDDLAKQLYLELWHPLKPWLPEEPDEKIVIFPHGSLFQVPFAALIDTEGHSMIQNHTISIAPSISTLRHVHQMNSGSNIVESYKALLVGNPVMPMLPDVQQLSNLPKAQEECEYLQAKLSIPDEKRKKQHFEVVLKTGSLANKVEVESHLLHSTLLHIATHGMMEFGLNKAGSLPGALVLSTGLQDGQPIDCLWTANQIQKLQLPNLKLAFLNCCDTGGGSVTTEGQLGLGRAFLYAGAKSVVLSIGPVPDTTSTLKFVKLFYDEYLKSQDAPAALRSAMVHMIDSGEPTEAWAIFYVLGL